jgi:hypothetical protein
MRPREDQKEIKGGQEGSKGKKMAKRIPKISKGSQNDVRKSQNGQKDLGMINLMTTGAVARRKRTLT